VLQSLIRGKSLLWVHFETSHNEVSEVGVLVAKYQPEGFAVDAPQLATWVFRHYRRPLVVILLSEELLPACRLIHYLGRGKAHHFHDSTQLVALAVARENWVTNIKLSSDAAETPHIDATVVWNSEHNLGSSVEPGLDVGVNFLVVEGTRAKINDLKSWLVGLFEQNIFGFQVTVNNFEHLQILKRVQELNSKSPDQIEVETLNRKILSGGWLGYLEFVDLKELKEVHGKQLEANNQVLPEDQVVWQMDHIDDVVGIILFQKLEDAQFNSSLIIILLFVFNHFQRSLLTSHMVEAFESSSKAALAQEGHDFEPEANVVPIGNDKVTLAVVVAIVVYICLWTLYFLSALKSDKIYLRIVLYF
jgi:hypothetical protein